MIKKKKKDNVNVDLDTEMKSYLFTQIYSYFEDDKKLKKVNMNRLVALYLIVTRTLPLYNEECHCDMINTLKSCITTLVNLIRRNVIISLDKIGDGCTRFQDDFDIVLNQFELPLRDLTGFTDDYNGVHADLFLEYFNNQISKNYENLEKLECVGTRKVISQISDSIQFLLDSRVDNVFTSDIRETILEMREHIIYMKNILINLQTDLSGYIVNCSDLMQNNNLSKIEKPLILAYEYSLKHGDDFVGVHEILMTDEIPAFPFKMLYINELSDMQITIDSEELYANVRGFYRMYCENLELFEQYKPDYWPAHLPNLSTDDGEPSLTVMKIEDFVKIIKCYLDFVQRVQNLSRGWSALLQSCFKYLECTEDLVSIVYENGLTTSHSFNSWSKSPTNNPVRKGDRVNLLGLSRGSSSPTLRSEPIQMESERFLERVFSTLDKSSSDESADLFQPNHFLSNSRLSLVDIDGLIGYMDTEEPDPKT